MHDPTGGHWYLRWFSVLVPAGALLLGALHRLRPGAGRPADATG